MFANRILEAIREETEKPELWFVVMPDKVWKYCRPNSVVEPEVRQEAIRAFKKAKQAKTFYETRSLFPQMDREAEPYVYEEQFHNQLKARLLDAMVLTQIIKESTVSNIRKSGDADFDKRAAARQSEIAWNLCTAIFYKVGGRPWKVADTRGKVDFQSAVTTAFKSGISKQFEKLVGAGVCLRYGFKYGNQSRIVSLQEAIEHNGFDFWYLDIQVDLQPGVLLSEKDVLPPSVMQWLPIGYGNGVQRTFKFKHVQMKTRERYEIQLLHPLVPATVLRRARKAFDDVCLCSPQHLFPIPVGVWEWRQPFGCVLCGQRYFCDCFRTALNKSQESDGQDDRNADLAATSESTDDADSVRYRSGICHLCTNTPSSLTFCHPMYGSAIKVRYGAYIEKFAIADGLTPRDAENKVRDILGVPRMGEGWISETQLFKLVKLLFTDHEVIREARFDWLGSQRVDIFIPAFAVAIEYQGVQHFKPVELLGGEAGFREAQIRDKRKRQLCKANGIKLIYFTHSEELSVEQVEKRLKQFLPDTPVSPNDISTSKR